MSPSDTLRSTPPTHDELQRETNAAPLKRVTVTLEFEGSEPTTTILETSETLDLSCWVHARRGVDLGPDGGFVDNNELDFELSVKRRKKT